MLFNLDCVIVNYIGLNSSDRGSIPSDRIFGWYQKKTFNEYGNFRQYHYGVKVITSDSITSHNRGLSEEAILVWIVEE